MTWQQIFIPCPHCKYPAPIYPTLTSIKQICPNCDKYFTVKADPPRQFSRDEWRAAWEASRAK